MIPPGWNVTEPIRIAVQTIRTVQSIKKAPADAQNFHANIESFDASLKALQSVIQQLKPVTETSKSLDEPLANVDLLEKDLEIARQCIQRCQQFSKRYNALARGDGNYLNRKAEASRWVWEDREVRELNEQLDKCIQAIQLKLQIISFSQTHRPNQALTVIDEDGEPGHGHVYQSSARRDVDDFVQQRWSSSTLSLGGRTRYGSTSGGLEKIASSVGLGIINSQSSPRMSDAEKRWSGSIVGDRNMSISSEDSKVFSTPVTTPTSSPMIPAKEKRLSISGNSTYFEGWSKEDEMLDMTGVRILVHRQGNERNIIKEEQPLSKIERHSFSTSKDVQILFFPIGKSRTRYVLRFSSNHPVIPQTEHSATEQTCIKLDAKLVAERLQSRRDSFASSFTVHSQRSNVSNNSDNDHPFVSKSEKPQPRLYFESERDWKRCQELIMGPGIKLEAQFSVQEVISNVRIECSLQRVRLWHKNSHQYLMFFTPGTGEGRGQHKEFDMMYLSNGKTKSKLEVKLLAQPLDKHGGGEIAGLTRPVDKRALQGLKYLSIKFESKQDRDDFVSKARHNGATDDFVPLSLSFEQPFGESSL